MEFRVRVAAKHREGPELHLSMARKKKTQGSPVTGGGDEPWASLSN